MQVKIDESSLINFSGLLFGYSSISNHNGWIRVFAPILPIDLKIRPAQFEPVQYYNLLLYMDFQSVILKSNPKTAQKMGILWL